MSEREEKEILAAEYALGTLDADDRQSVDARRLQEADLNKDIEAWEQRLSPLLETVADDAPRDDLFADIERAIDAGAADSSTDPGAQIITLRRQVTRWRIGAISAGAIAASLIAFMLVPQLLAPKSEQTFVAVFQDGDVPPRFVMSVDLDKRTLTISPVAASLPEGKTFQLWIKADSLGPDPQSLGLLDAPGRPTQKKLREFGKDLLQKATFGISVEPTGGSPTGRPSPGALHGKLIPAVF